MSNQNPWIFLSGFKPSTASWYFASACRKWGQERTGTRVYVRLSKDQNVVEKNLKNANTG